MHNAVGQLYLLESEKGAERLITTEELEDLILHSEIIEEYTDREPCPVVLVLGIISGRPCHAAIACCKDSLRIVTIYWPDEECWIDCSTRRIK